MWLKTEMSKINSSFDIYYQKINIKDKTWKSILELIENELEGQFLENQETLIGINFSVEIVKNLPEDIEIEDY